MSLVRSVIRKDIMLVFLIIASIILFLAFCGLTVPIFFGYIPDISNLLIILSMFLALVSLSVKQFKKVKRFNTEKSTEVLEKSSERDLESFSLMYWIEKILLLDFLNETFRNNLEECEQYLVLFEQKEVKVRPVLLEQIKRTLIHYYQLSNLPLPTERSVELQNDIELFFKKLILGFREIYERSLEDSLNEVEVNLVATSKLLDKNYKLR